MGRLFGTDGVRGIAVTELTCETAMHIGMAAAAVICKKSGNKAKIIVGKDTRLSSDIIEGAIVSGLLSAGADVISVGVLPTPALAYLVTETGAQGGIMISASRSSMEYNGIRLFSSFGSRFPEVIEDEIESLVLEPEKMSSYLKSGAETGRYSRDENAVNSYISYLLQTGEKSFSGMKIAVDCANGSACATAEKLFGQLGARVYLLNCEPDGTNINLDCGTSSLRNLIGFVKEKGCDLGIALDGDGDRCIAIDETGAVVDGDKLIAIFAKDMKERGILADNAAVVSVMSNLGLSVFAQKQGIKLVTTKVGDRYITEKMQAGGYSLGGEQSGHIIFRDLSLASDGQLTALALLSAVKRSGRRLSELAGIMERYPQVIINVKISPEWKERWKNSEIIEQTIEEKEKELGADGRILVRESGTEPIIRVMAEGKELETVSNIALEIAEVIRKNCPKQNTKGNHK